MSENSKFKYSGLSHETSLKVGVSQPLDTRTVVLNKTDLISDSVTKYAYYGMIVYVEEDKKQYYLDGNSKGEPNMSAAASNLDNWKEVGSEISNLSVNKIESANHAIFGVDYINPDNPKNVYISTELKGWYFASRIETVDATNNIYCVALSESSDQTVAFTATSTLSTISVDSKRDTSSKILSGLSVGDKISMKNYFSINNLLTVERIDGNVITYKFDKANSPNPTTTKCATGQLYRTPLTAGNPARVKECSIWCIDKPSIGVADLSQYNAIVGGSGCEVYGVNGFASGELNKVIDDYGAAFGKSNTVGYCCFSAGRNNNSTGCEYAATFGADLTTTNNYQYLVGYNFKAEKDTVFAVKGKYATAPALHIYQSLVEFGVPVTTNNHVCIGSNHNITSGSSNVVIGTGHTISKLISSNTTSYNIAAGNSHVIAAEDCACFGRSLSATTNYQTVVGKYNAKSSSLFVVGGGSSDSNRKNLFEVTTTGIKIGNTTLTEAQLKQLLELLKK